MTVKSYDAKDELYRIYTGVINIYEYKSQERFVLKIARLERGYGVFVSETEVLSVQEIRVEVEL